MSDDQIRQILLERKREARRQQRRAKLIEAIEGIVCWAGLIWIGFMLSVVGA